MVVMSTDLSQYFGVTIVTILSPLTIPGDGAAT